MRMEWKATTSKNLIWIQDGTGCMSNLVVTQTSPLKYMIRQASLLASPRQTPRSIFPDTSVLGRIISLISLLKHHLAMQRNHSAQNHNELCATHWKNRCVLHWGRRIRQYLSTLLKSLLLSFPAVRRRERYRSHVWCIMTFLTGGKDPGGAGDVSSSLHTKHGTVFSSLQLT